MVLGEPRDRSQLAKRRVTEARRQRGLVTWNFIVRVVNRRLCREERKDPNAGKSRSLYTIYPMTSVQTLIHPTRVTLSNPPNILQYYSSHIITSTLVLPNLSFKFDPPDTQILCLRYPVPNTPPIRIRDNREELLSPEVQLISRCT